VLVHCEAGISRSATMCIAYLMHKNGLTMDEAYDYVKLRRAVIAPNLNFMRQLSEFEVQLRERRRNRAHSATLVSSGERTRLRLRPNLWTPAPSFVSPALPSSSSFLFDLPSLYRLTKSGTPAQRRISLGSTRSLGVLQQSTLTTQLSPPCVCYGIIAANRSLRTVDRGCSGFDLSNVVSTSTSIHGPLIISSQ